MTTFGLFALTGVGLLVIGLHGLVLNTHLLRKILAINVMSGGVFLILVATAYRGPGESPDPVPHAMVLTGIVVAISATALALVMAVRMHAASGRPTLSESARSPGAGSGQSGEDGS